MCVGVKTELSGATKSQRRRINVLQMLAFVFRNSRTAKSVDQWMASQQSVQIKRVTTMQSTDEQKPVLIHLFVYRKEQ